MKQNRTNFTLRIDKELHKELKIYCLEKNIAMLELVQELIEKDIYKGDELICQK